MAWVIRTIATYSAEAEPIGPPLRRVQLSFAHMLSERAQTLLKILVERYIAEGQPVGSRALSRFSTLELSPATIRNVMADLEEMGFVSSECLPTDLTLKSRFHTSGRRSP